MAISGKVGAVYTQTSAAPVSFTDEATSPFGNVLTKNQSSVETDLTGIVPYGVATLTRDITEKLLGNASVKVVTPGSTNGEGVMSGVGAYVAPLVTYTASAWVKGSGTVSIRLGEYDIGGTYINQTAGPSVVLTNEWQRISVSRTMGATGVDARISVATTGSIQAITFFVDGLQIEEGTIPTSWKEGVGRTQFKVTNVLKRYFDKNSIITVKKNGVIQTSGFKVDCIGGLVTFDSQLLKTDTVTISGNYLTVAQSGGFFNWSLDGGADTSEVTTFQSNGWKEHQAALKEWSVSAEAYWGSSEFFDKLGTECIVILYLDTSSNLSFEGYGIVTGDGIETAIDSVIQESIDIQGNGILYLREG